MAEHKHEPVVEELIDALVGTAHPVLHVDAIERAVYWTGNLDPIDAIERLAAEVAEARTAAEADRAGRRADR